MDSEKIEKKSTIPKIIIGIFVLFVLFQTTAILIMSSRKVDLVTTNYYTKEQAFQKRIDEQSRSNKSENSVQFNFEPDKKRMFLQFPQNLDYQQINGSLTIYRPSDASQMVCKLSMIR